MPRERARDLRWRMREVLFSGSSCRIRSSGALLGGFWRTIRCEGLSQRMQRIFGAGVPGLGKIEWRRRGVSSVGVLDL